MNTKALKILEYAKIIDQLAGLTISPSGRDMALALTPSADLAEIKDG